MRDLDPRRLALMRDLLMDYPQQGTQGQSMPPEGLAPDEEDAWAEEQMLMNEPPLPLEGRYDGDMGRTEAAMGAYGPGAWQDVQGMREYLGQVMPKAGQIAPVPEDPEQAPTRAQALARQLRRG